MTEAKRTSIGRSSGRTGSRRRTEGAGGESTWTGPLFETALDRQIREATERGAFDNLPGAGKPIPDLDGPHDELWWVKQLVRREEVSLIPPSLALRREVQDIQDTVAREWKEATVRRIVTDLNERIAAAIRIPLEGPPVQVRQLDVDSVVAAWRAAR